MRRVRGTVSFGRGGMCWALQGRIRRRRDRVGCVRKEGASRWEGGMYVNGELYMASWSRSNISVLRALARWGKGPYHRVGRFRLGVLL